MNIEPTALGQAQNLLTELQALRAKVVSDGYQQFEQWRPSIERRAFMIGALNLAQYLAFRRRDLRDMQTDLMPWGLSSLGRVESRVMPNLEAVIFTLGTLLNADSTTLPKRPPLRTFFRGQRMLTRETQEVFGDPSPHRMVRIMVTFPSEAATDYQLVRKLLKAGMNCARINCAHDGPDQWGAMIEHVRRAEAEVGRRCKISMDLGGPKVRTGLVTMGEDDRLRPGDKFLLTRDDPTPDDEFPVQMSCTLIEAFDHLQIGHSVWFDDGKVGARVEALHPKGAVLRVTQARPKGERIKAEKGINFPDTPLHLSALTEKDRADLDFVAVHADIIDYSFVQDASDVQNLQAQLAQRLNDPSKIALVLKVETRRAVENLPELIVQAAGKQPVGVMIARGDLAVEIGYERLAEIQEEILWICEAAHVPVIWATQVLENLVRKGRPSRAEITDAAMGVRAECVMLNKGPFIVDGVTILDDVLARMQGHQTKKTAQLRALRSW